MEIEVTWRKNVQIVICDSDKKNCQQLEEWIKEYGRQIHLDIEVFYDSESLIKQMENNYFFDMIFLAVEFSGKTGIDIGNEIRHRLGEKVSIIFMSNDTRSCQYLFNIEPQNFHCKPLVKDNIIKDLKKAVQRAGEQTIAIKYFEDGVAKGILVKDIIHIEAYEKLLIITTIKNEKISIRNSIAKLAKSFAKTQLVQCHRSYMVNIFYIEKYNAKDINMINGDVIPIGRKYADDVKAILRNLTYSE